ncbi:hypothetical protein D9M70_520110 [compost metagenome]
MYAQQEKGDFEMIDGLKKLQRQMDEAQKALDALDGELGTVSFDPSDPGSIEASIQQVESIIDDRVGIYNSNPIIAPIAEQLKEKYRDAIIARAAAARSEEEE